MKTLRFNFLTCSQLKAEGFFEKHPKLAISFCSANFPDRPNEPYRPRRARQGLRKLFMMPLRLTNNIFGFLGKAVNAASGKFISRCADDLYANVVRIYPLQGAITSIEDIMGQGPVVGQVRTQTGLGSGYYSNRQGAAKATNGSDAGGSDLLWTPTMGASHKKRL